MQDFVFHNPTKVIFGQKSIDQCGHETHLHGRHALVISGQNHVEQSGLLERISHLLAESGVSTTHFSGVVPNPTVEKVRIGIDLAREKKVDVICCVGGGSVIDTGKAIAAGTPASHDVWKFFTGKKALKSALPVIAIPTIAGSGSDMNSGMVLTNEESRLKLGYGHRLLHPQVAFLDPTQTYSVPYKYTVFGAIDALTHLLEGYLTSTESNSSIHFGYAEGIARAIITNLEKALATPTDYDARSSLMWGSSLALNGLSVAGLGRIGFPMHLLEHPLSAKYNIAHGEGLAIIMVGWLKAHSSSLAKRITSFTEAAFGVSFPEKDNADDAIAHIENWLYEMGAPVKLSSIGVREDNLEEIAENAARQAKIWRMRDYTAEKISAILQLCGAKED